MKREDLKIIYALSKKYICKHINNLEEVPTYAILAERFDIPKHRVGKIMKELRKEGAI